MKKVISIVVVIIILIVGGFYVANSYIYKEKQDDPGLSLDYKNGRYLIDGKFVQLRDGVSKGPIPGAPGSSITTQYFGNEARGDFDGDGDEDVAFILTQDGGGSGIFFYLVGAIKDEGGYRGTHAVLIGDRISPQTTEFRNGQVIVNYADRKPGEAMATVPSVGKSLYLKYDPASESFGEVVQNFEGEADPSRMTLDMKKWNWVKTQFNNDTEVVPRQSGKFTLTFEPATSRFSASTDCNGVGGTYTAKNGTITFSDMMSTLMYCEGSQEDDFRKGFEGVTSYHFTSRGELVFDLKYDSGVMIFR